MSFVTEYALKLIRRHTPCRIHVGFDEFVSYKATGNDNLWLIGYGSKKVGRSYVNRFTKANKVQIEEQLETDLEQFAKLIAGVVYMPLTSKKRGAVLSYAHSIGYLRFKESNLLKLINERAHKTKIIKEWSPYLRKNYQQNMGLVDRRRQELALFLESDKDVPLLVEHKCILPQCLLNIAENFNGSPQQVKAIAYLEKKVSDWDPSGDVIDHFFELWNQKPTATGSRSAYPEVDLRDPELLRYASSLIPEESDQYRDPNEFPWS